MAEPRSAVVYCRTSTANQREAETIGAQVERCKSILARAGVRPLPYGPQGDGWLFDDGVSGSLLEGRTFATFVDDLEARRVRPDVLVVFSLSRIARLDKSSRNMGKLVRSAQDAARIKAVLLGAGVHVLDEQGDHDPASVMFDLLLTLSTEEYRLIRSRTMSGKARRLSEGRQGRGGKPPYGYVAVYANGTDRKAGFDWMPHPVDAPNLVTILKLYVEGGATHAAREATRLGIPTPMAKTTKRKNAAKDWSPTRWSPVSVQHVVRNVRTYLGEQTRVFDGVPYVLRFPAIISTKLYAAVERRRKERVLKRRATFLSTGYVDCACGAHLHERNSHDVHYARCSRGCGSMRQTTFEPFLWLLAVCRLIQIQKRGQGHADHVDPYGSQIDAAKMRLDAVRREITSLLDLYRDGLDRAVWKERNDVLNERAAMAQAEVDRLEAEREIHRSKRANEQTVEQRIGAVLAKLVDKDPPLELRRTVLADLLQGERVIVAWPKRKKGKVGLAPYAMITLPSFADLPAVTMRTDDIDPSGKILGGWVRAARAGGKLGDVRLYKPLGGWKGYGRARRHWWKSA